MNKAFIFDFDGVIVNNEPLWEKANEEVFLDFFGKEVSRKIGSTVGLNMDAICEKAVKCGGVAPKEKLLKAFYEKANKIYETATITPDLDKLCKKLVKLNYKIGIVSASPIEWLNITLNRTSFKEDFNFILSLETRTDLRHKPAPDGYIEAMKVLSALPLSTVILEDSNTGIASAKAAGVYTIGFKQNLMREYVQEGADIYVDTVLDIIPIIEKFAKNEF
jgi:beta-phosphoglucomutase-like phosphatase (HAD superfamily)